MVYVVIYDIVHEIGNWIRRPRQVNYLSVLLTSPKKINIFLPFKTYPNYLHVIFVVLMIKKNVDLYLNQCTKQIYKFIRYDLKIWKSQIILLSLDLGEEA